MSTIQWEYDLVERPFCKQLQTLGWQWIFRRRLEKPFAQNGWRLTVFRLVRIRLKAIMETESQNNGGSRYHVLDGRQIHGPFVLDVVKHKIASGDLPAKVWVCREHENEWMALPSQFQSEKTASLARSILQFFEGWSGRKVVVFTAACIMASFALGFVSGKSVRSKKKTSVFSKKYDEDKKVPRGKQKKNQTISEVSENEKNTFK